MRVMSRLYDRDGDRPRERRDYDRRDRDYDRRDRERDRDYDRRRYSRERKEDPTLEAAPRYFKPSDAAPPLEGAPRRKKRFGWDVDASGNVADKPAASSNTAQLTAMQQTAMLTAVLQQQAALTRRARRLHVGNLPPGMTPEALRELFNATMAAAKLSLDEGGCVNGVQMAGDAKFGFVEFRSVVECSSAIVLNGMQLLDKQLKVARPNDYALPPPGLDAVKIPESVSATVTSSNVPPQSASILGLHNPLAAAGLSTLAAQNSTLGACIAASCCGAASAARVPGVPDGAAGVAGLSGASIAALSTAGVLGGAAAGLAGLGGGGAAQQNLLALCRRARRLHIGNLPQGVGLTAEMLKQFFNAALVSASLHDTSKEGDPVLDSMLGSESKFGFVEFRTIAEATSCLALNNIELGEREKGMQHLKPEPMS